jgi:hypothetical protein
MIYIEGKKYDYDINFLIIKCQYIAVLSECCNKKEDIKLDFKNAYSSEIIKVVFDIIHYDDIRKIDMNSFIFFLSESSKCHQLMQYLLYDDIKKQDENAIKYINDILKTNLAQMVNSESKESAESLDIIFNSSYFKDCDIKTITKSIYYSDLFKNKKITDIIYYLFKVKQNNDKNGDEQHIINLTNFDIQIKQIKQNNVSFTMSDVHKRMKDFSYGLLSSDFLQKIDWNYTYISGGFILSCINNERFDWSDLDIWVTSKNTNQCMLQTVKLLELLNEQLNNIKPNSKIFWSRHNNVITIYCTDFKLNIQIIMTTDNADECIKSFDIDYIQCYYKNSEIYSTLWFLNSVMDHTIKQMNFAKINRLVKAFLKGYDFNIDSNNNEFNINCRSGDFNFRNQSQDIFTMLAECRESFLNKSCTNINNCIEKIKNKYFYPTMEDYNNIDYINKIILDRFGHKNVYMSFNELTEDIMDSNKVTIFNSIYELGDIGMYNENNKLQIITHNENIKNDIINGVANIYSNDAQQIVKKINDININDLFSIFGKDFVFSYIKLRYYNKEINELYIQTDNIILDYYTFNSENFTGGKHKHIKIWFPQNNENNINLDVVENTQKLFKFFDNVDNHLIKLIEPIKSKPKYHKIIQLCQTSWVNEDDKLPNNININNITKKHIKSGIKFYMKFKLIRDENDNILTKFYLNNELININDSTISNYIMIGSIVKFTICFDKMYKNKLNDNYCFPILFLSRVDIIYIPEINFDKKYNNKNNYKNNKNKYVDDYSESEPDYDNNNIKNNKNNKNKYDDDYSESEPDYDNKNNNNKNKYDDYSESE